jgi:hypothetical protein
MDIHKPKPWHGFREFLKEYLIIVVGVLTALGAEQAVEWLHWRHVVEDARAGLHLGLQRLLHEAAEREAESGCLGDEFANLRTLLSRSEASGRLEPIARIRSPIRSAWTFHSYDTIVSGQILPHLSLGERGAMITISGWSEYLQRNRDVEVHDWSILRTMEGPGRKIGDAEAANLRAALSEAIYEHGVVRTAARNMAQQIYTANVLSRAEADQAWSDGTAEGRQEGGCRPSSEGSLDVLIQQSRTPLNPPPATRNPPNWPGRVG